MLELQGSVLKEKKRTRRIIKGASLGLAAVHVSCLKRRERKVLQYTLKL